MIRRIFGKLWTVLRGKGRACTSSPPVREVLSLYLGGGLFLRVVDTECGIVAVGPTAPLAIELLKGAADVILSSYRACRTSSDTPERQQEEAAKLRSVALELMREINYAVAYSGGSGSHSSGPLPYPRVGYVKTRPHGSAGG